MGPDTIVVLITVPSQDVGGAIARAVVEEHLAACVNLVPGITSIFRWDGKVQTETEALLIVKTRPALFGDLAARVRTLHPYTVPEIIALPLAAGNQAYLDWVRESVRSPDETPKSP